MARKAASLREWRKLNANHIKAYKKQYEETHKMETAQTKKEYRANHPEQTAANHKAFYLEKLYGLTLDEYNQMFESQNGKCAICGKHQSQQKKAFAVDHDHKTGKIRGLLCSSCNTGIGNLHDDEQLLVNAIKYLVENR